MKFNDLFTSSYPIIGCIHLAPLPGSPNHQMPVENIFQKAVEEAKILYQQGVHGLIVENFGDAPFYKNSVPPITISTMTIAVREILRVVNIPVGVNVLRNDAESAMSIATANGASFIRVNIHMHAMLTDQGIIEGKSFDTLRLRRKLGSNVQIWTDIAVKHAQPLVIPDLVQWTYDLIDRGQSDALIVTGTGTGHQTDTDQLKLIKTHCQVPVLIGSGLTPENIDQYIDHSDGAIVGSYFKKEGKAIQIVESDRVRKFMNRIPK